jgi:hypothetical protein
MPRRTTVFLAIAAEPVQTGCSLGLRQALDRESSAASQCISLDQSDGGLLGRKQLEEISSFIA